LRLSSIDQVEADPALVEAIAGETRLMPHLHLSLQAGDDMILKRMKRRHLRDSAIRFCEEIRAVRPEMVFGADLIAGFPTETEEMFENTARLIEDCGLTWLHIFPFSPRQGTPAARMPQVPKAIRKTRAARLREIGTARTATYLASRIGQTEQVLIETPTQGRSESFAEVTLATARPVTEVGQVIPMQVTGVESGRLQV
ncbi:MAG: radical SAM protein, partial [Pseudomonadota bacterium]